MRAQLRVSTRIEEMCGIAGILQLDGSNADGEALQRMADALAHRGPDGAGVWRHGPLGLAHTRLAVIDLDAGDQPMVREDLARAIVFNGEIYNYVELRRELESSGQRFFTRSDTEVILVGHAHWGDAVLSKLRGMFALALWDAREKRLLLARDRLGKKPLAVHISEGRRVAFASEAKALFHVPGIQRRAEPGAIATYLDLMYVPEQVAVWRDVERLPPGSWLAVERDRVFRGRYWEPTPVESPEFQDFEHACAEARARLEESTRIRLRADVPVGVFLSGGVDSTLVALSAARQIGTRIRAFTVGFDGVFDERRFAQVVARAIDAELTVLDIRLDGPALIQKVAKYFDEPFGDTSAVPTLAMSWETKAHVKVVLSGDGGDELFGGYDTYLRHLRLGGGATSPGTMRRWAGGIIGRLKRRARTLPTPLAKQVAWLARPYRARIDSFADARRADPVIRQAEMMRVAHFQEPADVLRPLLAGTSPPALADVAARCPRFESPVKSAMLFDQLVYLPGDILKKVDIASMSTGLEVRSPILDDRMLALAHSLPTRHHVVELPNASPEHWRKRVLKRLCEEQMGSEFTYRQKAGFALPLQEWLDQPAFVDCVESGFVSTTSPIRFWFRAGVPRELWRAFRDGKRWLAQEVWNLIMLDAWAREHRPEF